MRPVLFTVFGLPVQSYGVSKVLAAFLAAMILKRAFSQRGWRPQHATTVVISATVWGFIGAKLYYLAEHARTLSIHDLGPMGFTWYGGFAAGALAVWITARRLGLPLAELAGMSAVPLSVAYGVGRLGCLLSGDGTYGKPSTLPWAMAFPDGMVATTTRVHPTPLYETVVAFALAAALWWAGRYWRPTAVFAAFLAGSGLARLLIEELRINAPALWGLTQPQLWSLGLIALAATLAWRSQRGRAPGERAEPARAAG